MDLSGNAKRAMEVVERNLSILYGAGYFTDEEWVKVDSLIHKGKYVLSDGPPRNDLLEEPLMTFEETKEAQEDVVEVPTDEFFCQTKSDSIAISEESVSSPPSEHGDSLPSPANTSETPVETSDEDCLPQPTPTAEPAHRPGSPKMAVQAASQPATAEPKPATNNCLPPGCTQEQLDEIRAFNASLTKAGQKSRPKYAPIDEDPPEWIDDYNELPREEESYPSPPPTEREARISTWADGVAKLPASPSIESPIPSRGPPGAPAVEVLAEQFIKAHGRQPKSLNDFYQPNNPSHHPRRPGSGASMVTTKTSASIKTAAQSAVDRLANGSRPPNSSIVLGKVYVAQSGAPQKGIRIQINPGDHIRVIKFVSGIMYIGENLRSHEQGQFPETIFMRNPATSQQQSAMAERTLPSFQRGLDQLEHVNAAEWDDVSSIKRPETAAPTSRSYLGGGLAASRFSAATDRGPTVPSAHAQQGGIASDMAGQIGKIINDKVEEILKARGVAAAPKTASKNVPNSVHPVQPKTETCWYWSVKNDCRFTAEECRDLHAFIPNKTGEPTNLRQGKPTWGALADSLPSPSSTTQPNVGVIGDGLKANSKTCYYWAVAKSCNNSAESCKYLHEFSPLGIAPKPGWTKPASTWKREWRAQQDQEVKLVEDDLLHQNDLVLEEVVQGEIDGWGQPVQKQSQSTWGGSVWGDDKYKPPQVKALEEQVAAQAVGW